MVAFPTGHDGGARFLIFIDLHTAHVWHDLLGEAAPRDRAQGLAQRPPSRVRRAAETEQGRQRGYVDMGVQDPGESGDVVGTRCGAFPFTAFRRPDYSPSLTTLVIQRKYLLLVTLTGVLAAVTNTSQTRCLRNTSYEHYERLNLSAFISQAVTRSNWSSTTSTRASRPS